MRHPRWLPCVLCAATLLGAALPATADPAAPALVRCDQTLTTVDGTELPYSSWGASEGAAREQAGRVARLLALLHFDPDLLNGMMFGETERAAARLTALREATPTAELRVPGYALTAGACTPVPLPEAPAGSDWTATWTAPGESTARPSTWHDPATAVEASRRRTCVAAYEQAYMAMFEAVAHVELEQKASFSDEGIVGVLQTLADCYAGTAPALVAAEVPAGAAAPGLHECSYWAPGGEALVPVAVGWGAPLDVAAEMAQQEAAYAIHERGLAMGFEAVARASAEQKMSLLAAGITDAMRMTASTEAIGRSHLRCRSLEIPATGTLRWTPGDPRTAAECGLDQPPPPEIAYDQPGGLAPAQHALCAGRLLTSVGMVQEAVRNAAPEQVDPLTAAGWGIVHRCEASCLADTRPDGATGTPVPVPGLPDRSTAEAAADLLDRAVEQRDLDLLMLLCPMMDDPRLRDQVAGDADGFWNELTTAREKGQFQQMLVWKDVDGVWTLVPSR